MDLKVMAEENIHQNENNTNFSGPYYCNKKYCEMFNLFVNHIIYWKVNDYISYLSPKLKLSLAKPRRSKD